MDIFRSQFFGGNRCNEPLKLFLVKRQSSVAVFFVCRKREGMEKRIEVVEMRAGDIKTGFGNSRKITQKKIEKR